MLYGVVILLLVFVCIITIYGLDLKKDKKHESIQEKPLFRIDDFRLTNLDSCISPSVATREIWLCFTTQSEKPIKYLYYTADFYNRVNEKVYTKTYPYMGPFYEGDREKDHYYEIRQFEHASVIEKAVITEMAIKYMDDTIVWIKDDDLAKIVGPKTAYAGGVTQTDKRLGNYTSPLSIIVGIIAWGLILLHGCV